MHRILHPTIGGAAPPGGGTPPGSGAGGAGALQARLAALTAHLPPYDDFVRPAIADDAQLEGRYLFLLRDYAIRNREPYAKVWRRLYVSLYRTSAAHIRFLNDAYAKVLTADVSLPKPARVRELYVSASKDVASTFEAVLAFHLPRPGVASDARWRKKTLVDFVAYCLCGDASGFFDKSAIPLRDPPIGAMPVGERDAVVRGVTLYVTSGADIEDRADAALAAGADRTPASVVAALMRASPQPSVKDVERLLVWASSQQEAHDQQQPQGGQLVAAFDRDIADIPGDLTDIPEKGVFANLFNDDAAYAPFSALEPLQQLAIVIAYSIPKVDDDARRLRKLAFAAPTQLASIMLDYVVRNDDFASQQGKLDTMLKAMSKLDAEQVIKSAEQRGVLRPDRAPRALNRRFVRNRMYQGLLFVYMRMYFIATFMRVRTATGGRLLQPGQLTNLVADTLTMLKTIR